MENESNSTGDRATRFEHQETLVDIERFRFRMFVHPPFLCTKWRFGLHFVDHRYSIHLNNSSHENKEAGISSGFSHHR
jgi:hypothetical protein